MGIGDKVRQGVSAAKEAAATRAEEARQARAQQEAEAAQKAQARRDQRERVFQGVREMCPLPVVAEQHRLPGGLELFDDEFLVTIGKDWGISSKQLVLTTQRVIYARGRTLTSKDQKTVYLRDVRDVRFHKPLIGPGTLFLETAGGRSAEGLPSVKNGKQVRDQLLTLVHFARGSVETPDGIPTRTGEDTTETLRKLGELRDAGVLTDSEFDAKKAELLSRI